MRRRLVVDETGVGKLLRATVRGALDERAGARVVPRLLRTKLARGDEHHEDSESHEKPHGGKLVAG